MTLLAEAHKVVIVITAAVGDGFDVMDFGGGNETVDLKAVLTERMLGEIQVTNLAPAGVIMFSRIGITVILVIFSVRFRSVNLTITPSGNVRATGMRALPRRFIRHKQIPFRRSITGTGTNT